MNYLDRESGSSTDSAQQKASRTQSHSVSLQPSPFPY